MSRKLPQLWAKKGAVRVSDVGFGFYVVNFETISDYDRAMFGGPWMVNDHYVVIQEWRPYFQPEETFLSTLRVWVRLPGIPFEYFDSAILKLIGDRIGKTVRIDHTTLEGSRGNFARLTCPNLFSPNIAYDVGFGVLSMKVYTLFVLTVAVMVIRKKLASRRRRQMLLRTRLRASSIQSFKVLLSRMTVLRSMRTLARGCK
ncbi:hypothetical protein LINPERHAP2_LOCUS33385 [Linum perenne]